MHPHRKNEKGNGTKSTLECLGWIFPLPWKVILFTLLD